MKGLWETKMAKANADLSERKAQMRDLALRDISTSSGNDNEFLWSMILPYVPTSESA